MMKATISGVDLFLMAYAWSQKGIAYILSTCGTTVRHSIDYRSKFPDGFGNTDSRSYPRPSVAHFLYEFLPLIDEHNKARQNLLALEMKWPTKCCWFRLMTTFIGMAVVDVQRWDRNKRKQLPAIPSLPDEDGDYEEVDNLGAVHVYADLIAKKLRDKMWAYRVGSQPTARQSVYSHPSEMHPLVRYKKNGTIINDNGKPRQRYCYTCRLYGDNANTQWACRECNMPLCNMPRRGVEWDCYTHHKTTNDIHDGCGGEYRASFIVPEQNLLYRQLPKKRAEQTRRDGIERRDSRRPKRSREMMRTGDNEAEEEAKSGSEEEECIAFRTRGQRGAV